MRLTVLIAACLVLLGTMIFGGCTKDSPTPPAVASRVVHDDLGRSVRIPENVQRVVSLAPSLTESIFAVGAGDKLIGVTTYCNYPEAASGKEKIGDTQTPNIERIVALKPDVVFVSTASQLEAFMSTLDQQGIAVYVMDAKSLAEVFDDLRMLGRLLGTENTASRLVTELDERVKRRRRAYDSKFPLLRVFVQISNEPLFTIGKDSFLTEIVGRAGVESVTKTVPGGYPKLSKETASAMNPDVIVMSDSEDNKEPNSVFANSPALQHGRILRINPDIISRPGPRLVEALEQISDFLWKDE